ncbi:MAG: hypothetical protein MR972_06930, partial [Oscillibacter sp.]|nr:hypothetical protein [Oscillibacter sp.]
RDASAVTGVHVPFSFLSAKFFHSRSEKQNARPCRFRQGRVQVKYSTAVFFMQEKVAALS